MKINFSVQDIVDIHEEIIKCYGGDRGVVSLSSLDFVLNFTSESNNEEFFDILGKILRAIVIDHPFVDGNKRTGIVVIESILEDNNMILSIDEIQKEEFILKIAKMELSLKKIIEYLKNNVD
ncbi:MAG: type II toxin-antitoxin system death-on-curing family toxin, partial [archaeon]